MLTNRQKMLVKQAQRDARLSDAEYREVWQTVAGVSSSTDPRLSDEHMDTFMSYVEAIYWRKRDDLVASSIFRARGYWAHKNTKAENSRDRFAADAAGEDIAELHERLRSFGYTDNYFEAIKRKVNREASGVPLAHWSAYALALYRGALQRTLKAKRKKAGQPF